MRPHVALFLVALLATTVFTFAQETSNSASAIKPVSNAGSPSPLISGTGTPNRITKWLTSTSLGNSGIFEKSTGNVGIGTTAPAALLDVNGKGDVRDTLTLFPKSIDPTLAISGTAFKIDQTGKVTFISGQKFPGTGNVTTVNSGTGLTGGPIHTSGTLSVNSSVVPLLANSNVFTANQTINGYLLADFVFLNGSNGGGAIGEGGNPTAGQPGNPLTVFGGSPSTPATDVAGGDLILQGGVGVGAGGSGAVRIQTAPAGPSGGTQDSFVDRQVFAAKAAPMGGQAGAANIVYVNTPGGDASGVLVRFTINANDGGTNIVAQMGSCMLLNVADNSGGSDSTFLFGADTVSVGSTPGPNAYCFFIFTDPPGIGIGDSLAFTPLTHYVYYEIDNVSGSPLSLATTAVPANRSLRVDAQHPKLTIHRSR
jgi:hypothetical protein